MTMVSMDQYLENRGFDVKRKYEPSIRKYKFTISKNDCTLSMPFEYPATGDAAVRDKKQREFLEEMIAQFKRDFEDEKSLYPKTMTMCDKDVLGIIEMVHELAKHGIKATYEYVRDMSAYRIIAKKGDWYIAKYVKEFKPLSDPEIPIIFYAEERRYVLNSIIEEFKRKKEKEMANNIEWKVDNITVDRRFGEADTFKAEIVGRMNGVVVGDYADIANGLQKKLNAKEVDLRGDLYEYILNDIRIAHTAREAVNRRFGSDRLPIPAIQRVIFNNPATIVIWADDTKTVVKAQNNELFDPEKGLAMAITKKALGNEGNYFDTIKKHVTEYQDSVPIKKLTVDISVTPIAKEATAAMKKLTDAIPDSKNKNKIREVRKSLLNLISDKKKTKDEMRAAMVEILNDLGGCLT